MYIRMYMYVCMHVCIYVYVYIYIFIGRSGLWQHIYPKHDFSGRRRDGDSRRALHFRSPPLAQGSVTLVQVPRRQASRYT